MARVNLSYARCEISVVGIEMDCPLCGGKVRSGEQHSCSKIEAPKVRRRKIKSRRKNAADSRGVFQKT